MSGPDRTCGTCSLCCKVMPIQELEKPDGVWCRHARVRAGCGIYETRPQVCRAFMCQWLISPAVPEALKPERSKVILTTSSTTLKDGSSGQQLVAACDPADPTAWRREPMYSFLKRQTIAQGGRPQAVLVRAGKRVWLMTAQADLDLGEASGTRTFSIETGADGLPTARLDPSEP